MKQICIYNYKQLNYAKVPLVCATVVESEHENAQVGTKMVFATNGERIGTLGNSTLETDIENRISDILEQNRAELIHTEDKMSVFLEPLQPRPTLLIAGAGHVGQALCHLATWLDFDVTIIDDRADFASKERLPEADEIIIGDIAEELGKYPKNHLTYVVISNARTSTR